MIINTADANEIIVQIKSKIVDIDSIPPEVIGNCVFTKGVFDLLHFGHLALFAYLKTVKENQNLYSVIAVASDKLVKINKGENRPINSQNDRLLQIALLPQIDYVLLHNELEYSSTIKVLNPKVYIKGMDTAGNINDIELLSEKNPEFKLMSSDSKIVIFTDDGSASSSEIIKRVIKSNH